MRKPDSVVEVPEAFQFGGHGRVGGQDGGKLLVPLAKAGLQLL